MSLFSKKAVDRDIVEWQFENFQWLIENLSQHKGLADYDLWLPTPEHFGDSQSHSGHALAQFVFDRICQRCHINLGEISLTAVEEAKSEFLDGGGIIANDGSACGRYFVHKKGDKFSEEITYDSQLTGSPLNLIATLAHETAHALHNRSVTPLDIEPELYELFTDLTAVYMGYGLFLANTRFSFESNNIGWQAQGAGYLPEADLVFATALFMRIKDIGLETALPHLKLNLAKRLKNSFKQLAKYEAEVEHLKYIDPLPWPHKPVVET